MNLATVRSVVRPLATLETEYRMRSLVSAVIPKQSSSDVRRGYHFCNWKTGSQWVRLVLSDPRLQRATGLPARLHENRLGEPPQLVRRQFPRVDRCIATPLFAGQDALDVLGSRSDDRAVFVTRHPRDLLVSYYFTNLENHPLNPDVEKRRRELTNLTVEQGLLRTLDHGFDEMIRIGDSWSEEPTTQPICPVRVVKYEALRGEQADVEWRAMLEHITGVPVSAHLVQRLLATYSARNMRSAPGATSKLRDRSTAGWQHHFTPAVDLEFQRRFGDVEHRWGYSRPSLEEHTTNA